MKTLSIKQPWAQLICMGIKDVENRTWKTNFRGKIFIHAPVKDEYKEFSLTERQDNFIGNDKEMLNNKWCKFIEYDMEKSAIIGSAEIVDCVKDSSSPWAEEGCYHWILKNPELFEEPILNVKGKLSLWEY